MFLFLSQSRREEKSAKPTAALRASRARSHLPSITQRQRTRKLSKKEFPLSIYDTRGFELGKDAQKEVKQEVLNTIKEGIATKDINKAIHCIWYCINTASNRIEQEEIDWLRDFSKENQITQVPVIIILTQAFSKKKADELRKFILDQNLDVVQVVPVLAEDYEIDDEYIATAHGLDLLIRVMSEALPDELQDTLQNVQIASLEEKKRYAQAAVATATAAAVGECLVPLPLTDCAMLIPAQVAMIASITAIFGFDVSKSVITGFVSSTIGAGGATVLGKTVVANLLKLIPGAGSAAGGAISSATAGILTTALEETYIFIMCAIFRGEMSTMDLETEEGKKKIKELFKEQLIISGKKRNV